jgi:hypothetical protein
VSEGEIGLSKTNSNSKPNPVSTSLLPIEGAESQRSNLVTSTAENLP